LAEAFLGFPLLSFSAIVPMLLQAECRIGWTKLLQICLGFAVALLLDKNCQLLILRQTLLLSIGILGFCHFAH
jgi:hypothetical protein